MNFGYHSKYTFKTKLSHGSPNGPFEVLAPQHGKVTPSPILHCHVPSQAQHL